MEHLPNKYGTRSIAGIGCSPKHRSHTDLYDNLRVTSLTEEQHLKTCGYWYLVTSRSMSHTAFKDRENLLQWMEERCLTLKGELAMAGTNSTVQIAGAYRRTSHMSYDEFYSLEGTRVRIVDNGDYTLGIICVDDDHFANVHHLNCNLSDRLIFDYQTSRALVG